jgi:hypothetical protein
MNDIELYLHDGEEAESKVLKIPSSASIEQLIKESRSMGFTVAEFGDEIVIVVDEMEIACRKEHTLQDRGIKNGNHVRHKRLVTIIVNAEEKLWGKKEISYRECVILAFGTYSEDPRVTYTVSYKHGPEPKPSGTLVKGQSVKVKEGMIFHVTKTDKS